MFFKVIFKCAISDTNILSFLIMILIMMGFKF